MTNKHAFWNGTLMQFIRKAMSRYAATIRQEPAISVLIFVALPYPALIIGAWDNALPKTVNQGRAGTMPIGKPQGLSPNPAFRFVRLWSFRGLLSATTLTKAMRNGIMGLHKKFTFLVSKPRTLARRSATSIGLRYPHSIARMA
jgi:hypothetical protein